MTKNEALKLLEKATRSCNNTEEQRALDVLMKEALAQPNEFNPDWDAMAVMVEEQQRMAKRIEDLEALLERQTARIVDLQTHINNLEG